MIHFRSDLGVGKLTILTLRNTYKMLLLAANQRKHSLRTDLKLKDAIQHPTKSITQQNPNIKNFKFYLKDQTFKLQRENWSNIKSFRFLGTRQTLVQPTLKIISYLHSLSLPRVVLFSYILFYSFDHSLLEGTWEDSTILILITPK